jgi:DNA polymerase III psi subunit
MTEQQSVFLIDILNACKLNMNDVAVVNLHQNKEVTHKKLATELEAKIVLLFGVSTEEINLPFTIPEFQVQSFNTQKYMRAPSLDILQNEIELKKKLWTSLKQIFL